MDTKRCTQCGQEKSISAFNKQIRRRDGFSSECKECGRARSSVRHATHREEDNKKARKYRETHLEELRERDRKRYADHPEGIREKNHKYREAHPEKAKELHRKWNEAHPRGSRNTKLRKNYGITLETYDALFASQGGVCAICGEPESLGRELSVDHVHDETKRVRGLLCSRCNVAVGHIESLPGLATLIQLLEYIG